MSKQHKALSKGRNFTIESFDIVAVCGNKVECCFDKVERCFDNVACCFDIVADVDGALRLVLQFLLFVLGTWVEHMPGNVQYVYLRFFESLVTF